MILSSLFAIAFAADARATPPRRGCPNLYCYFSTDDYPAAAIQAGAEGDVRFRLQIGLDGRVSECTIVASSGSADLDEATCRILRERAQYTPGRDPAGRLAAGSDVGTVAWRLPSNSTIPAQNCTGCTGPRANLGIFFSTDDYPRDALRARAQGRVHFRLRIGIDGRVERCEVTISSGTPSLDYQTCAILLVRGQYTPARDPNGALIEGVDNGTVTWRLPGS